MQAWPARHAHTGPTHPPLHAAARARRSRLRALAAPPPPTSRPVWARDRGRLWSPAANSVGSLSGLAISFFEGGRYRNKQGSYTVVRVECARLRVQMDDGRRGWFTVDKQRRKAVALPTVATANEAATTPDLDEPEEPRRVSPPRGQLDRLRTPLTLGEKFVYQFFE